MPDPLSLGFSPCPNDTFMFDALVHDKTNSTELVFEPSLADVEELNQKALKGELDITKISYHAYGHLSDQYQLLNSGSALGRNCGPLLIAKNEFPAEATALHPLTIAIPGKLTTANFLLSLAFPEATQKVEMLFSDIENAVLNGDVDAGLIIHENRFTYQQKGLKKIIDLGEYWESTTGLPIPLGGIAVKRDLPLATKQAIDQALKRSISFAFANPDQSFDYVRSHAQEMEKEVMYSHIELYVNKFSEDLGEEGRKAVATLFEKATALNLLPKMHPEIFVPQHLPTP